jgi:hypothetical protein
MRQARVARRRVSLERADAIRRMLDVPASPATPSERHGAEASASAHIVSLDCPRRFTLPMHLARHRKAKHEGSDAA